MEKMSINIQSNLNNSKVLKNPKEPEHPQSLYGAYAQVCHGGSNGADKTTDERLVIWALECISVSNNSDQWN